MARHEYQIPGADGAVIVPANNKQEPFHQLTFKTIGTPGAGSLLSVEARPRGSDIFLPVSSANPSGLETPLTNLDLTDIPQFQLSMFTGDVADWRFTLASTTGIDSLVITDIAKSYVLGD